MNNKLLNRKEIKYQIVTKNQDLVKLTSVQLVLMTPKSLNLSQKFEQTEMLKK